MKLNIARKEIESANTLGVAVGSNCPQGGDTGHGGRTYFSIEDLSCTDLRVSVDGRGFYSAKKVEIVLGGDCEHSTFIQALEFALVHLRGQAAMDELELE